MQYFTLEPACDTPETGHVYPQIQKLKPGYDRKKPNSIYSYLKKSTNGFPDEAPDLDSFIMHGHAKPTDLVSNAITGVGLFVSQKMKAILEKHNLPPHKFYAAKVIYKGKPINEYYWLHFHSDLTDYINYPDSSFFIYKRFNLSMGDITINSKDEYSERIRQLQSDIPDEYLTIKAKKIVLSPVFFNKKLDLFKIGRFDINFYVSEILRDALIENNISGCNTKVTDRIIV